MAAVSDHEPVASPAVLSKRQELVACLALTSTTLTLTTQFETCMKVVDDSMYGASAKGRNI